MHNSFVWFFQEDVSLEIIRTICLKQEMPEVHADEEGEDSNATILKLSQLMTAVEDVKSIYESNSKKLDELHKVVC